MMKSPTLTAVIDGRNKTLYLPVSHLNIANDFSIIIYSSYMYDLWTVDPFAHIYTLSECAYSNYALVCQLQLFQIPPLLKNVCLREFRLPAIPFEHSACVAIIMLLSLVPRPIFLL